MKYAVRQELGTVHAALMFYANAENYQEVDYVRNSDGDERPVFTYPDAATPVNKDRGERARIAMRAIGTNERILTMVDSPKPAGATLPDYNPTATCRKCGHDDIMSIYYEELHWSASFPPTYGSIKMRAEHIGRRCARCGYKWPEATLDRKDAEADDANRDG